MPETAFDNHEHEQTGVSTTRQIHGLLVAYQDDGIHSCVHSALKGKKRVYYKCLDVMSNFMALGTSVGAIYLFRLSSLTHSTCQLVLVLPCDQGPIEVIRFVSSRQSTNHLLIIIGTARGSLVIFQLNLNETQAPSAEEIYRAERFTKSESIGIKFIEPDQDLLEPWQPFTKLYICDQKCRIFVLDSNSIYPAFPLLYNNKPTPVLDVLESEIHQIFVHKSQLLLSTDERTQVFKEYSARPDPIGKTQRKRGFFGACFFNANYKPARLQQHYHQPHLASSNRISASQQTIYSSTASLADLENIIIYVSRPKFSLWQVNYKREVLFTNKFGPSIKSTPVSKVVPLTNEPLRDVDNTETRSSSNDQTIPDDNPAIIDECFNLDQRDSSASPSLESTQSDHFERLIPIFSTTLGNLLLSHTRHEIFVIDPTSARMLLWHSFAKPIQQVCCNENEIFILFEAARRNYQVERIVLLAPTQFVLELHRLNRRRSLMAFVELFSEQFRYLMALPLSGPGVITTEGGLLRNIIWSTWRDFSSGSRYALEQDENHQLEPQQAGFKSLVDEIIDESMQLRKSIENLTDSQLFFTASNDNIERLCTEPYASMVSLDISIANLHTNHVVHFSQEALSRQKSLAKLSQSIVNLNQLKRTTSARLSLLDLNDDVNSRTESDVNSQRRTSQSNMQFHFDAQFNDKKVLVEPIKTKKSQIGPINNLRARAIQLSSTKSSITLNKIDEAPPSSSPPAQIDPDDTPLEEPSIEPAPPAEVDGEKAEETEQVEVPRDDYLDRIRCLECKWPKPRAHLKPMHHSQQIQYGWLQENLVPNFEENIEQIEERAFRHGLWHLVLRCLAFKNKLNEYIDCCIMLDDVRLLSMERFVNIKCSEEEFINLVFKQLEIKLDFLDNVNGRTIMSTGNNTISTSGRDLTSVCLKCKNIAQLDDETRTNNDSDQFDDEDNILGHRASDDDSDDDDISFNLVNLFKKIMLRRSADIKRAVGTLLQHPKLLDRSKISAAFYLQALGNQCSILRRTRLKL